MPCAVAGCQSVHKKGQSNNISFFRFPNQVNDRLRFELWVDRCRRISPVASKKWEPSKDARVCSKHFELDSWEIHPLVSFSLNLKDRRPCRLKTTAIPTIFSYKSEKCLTPPSPSKFYSPIRPALRKKLLNELLSKPAETPPSLYIDEEIQREAPSSPGPLQSPAKRCRTSDYVTVNTETLIVIPKFSVRENKKTYVKTTQTPGPSTSDTPSQYSLKDIDPSETTETTRCITTSTAVQCNLIGGNLWEEEGESEEEEPDQYEDDITDDSTWLPNTEDILSDSDEEDEEAIHQHSTPLTERKYIVFQSCLLSLFVLCNTCFAKCSNTMKTIGGMVIVKSECVNGHIREWQICPESSRMPVTNLCLAASSLFSGCSPVKMLNFLKFCNISSISRSTYFTLQKCYLIPAINIAWSFQQDRLIKTRRNQHVKLAGDGRCCSPGHTAKYGSYTLMDATTGEILTMDLIQSNEVKNSNAMELEGLKRGLAHLSSENIVVTDIITDRHSQVRKWLRLEFPKIHHWFDVWHVAKSVVKKLEAVARKSKCGIVSRWAQSIKNHLYWCAASSNGNREEVLEKWTSIERHVTNIHEGHGNFYPQCQHGEIKRPWIDTGTKAHKELKEIVCSTRLKNDIAQLSFEEQTAYLESYHKIVCFFAAKHGHFFYPSMEARIQLAVLHFNENVNKDQAITKDGRPCWKISYPKFKKGGEVVKQVKVPVTYDYVTDLLDSVWNLRTDFPSYKEAQQNLVRPESSVPEFTTSRLTKRSKEEAVQSFKSRYSTR